MHAPDQLFPPRILALDNFVFFLSARHKPVRGAIAKRSLVEIPHDPARATLLFSAMNPGGKRTRVASRARPDRVGPVYSD